MCNQDLCHICPARTDKKTGKPCAKTLLQSHDTGNLNVAMTIFSETKHDCVIIYPRPAHGDYSYHVCDCQP